MNDKPNRRWYQFGFSIRDLLWLTIVVALGMGWWMDRRNSAADRARMKGMAEEFRVVMNQMLLDKAALQARESQLRAAAGRGR